MILYGRTPEYQALLMRHSWPLEKAIALVQQKITSYTTSRSNSTFWWSEVLRTLFKHRDEHVRRKLNEAGLVFEMNDGKFVIDPVKQVKQVNHVSN